MMRISASPCGRAALNLVQKNLLHLRSVHFFSRSGRAAFSGRRPGTRKWQLPKESCPVIRSWGAQRENHVLVNHSTALDTNEVIVFTEISVDRASVHRTDSAWLASAFDRKDTIIVPVMENKSLVKSGRAVFLPSSAIQRLGHGDPIFLGISKVDDVPIFAVDLKEVESADWIKEVGQEGAEWIDVRRYGPQLQVAEAGLLAYARGMVEWQYRNRHCGHCGSRSAMKEGGHSLKCTSETCGKSSYPRMDPAVIMLITLGDYALLGRQGRWDAGRYSVLAGFVEIGETFEAAVGREVKEEAGLDVDMSTVRYVASQPWPFPSSLMVGFRGLAKKKEVEPYNARAPPHGQVRSVGVDRVPEVDEVNSLPLPTPDGKELEDVRWVHKTFLRSLCLGEPIPHYDNLHLPGKYSIANVLLQTWAADETATKWAGSDVPTVDIDEGKFKYVLMRISDGQGNQKLVVRGKKTQNFHTDVLDATYHLLKPIGIEVEQLGGGRINHEAASRTLHVFSSSQAFGQADHTVTSCLLRQAFPLHSISVSWDS